MLQLVGSNYAAWTRADRADYYLWDKLVNDKAMDLRRTSSLLARKPRPTMMKRQTLISTVSNDRFIPPGSEKAYSSTGFQQVTDCNGGDSKGMASQVDPVVGKHFSNHAAVTQFYFNHEPEKGLCAPSPHSNHHSYLEGFSTDYIITQSVPTDSMLKAIEQDHASATNDLHRTLIPRSHYEILPMHPSTKVPLTDLNIPLDGSIISIGLINLLSTSRGTVTLASTGYIAGPARSIRTIALRRSPASFYEQRCYRMFFNTTRIILTPK
ncbi:MAG: hypothetical protein L6R35_002965 [Caloplaca aegaea]|nr:MAG: hypothetical protein L6R35_002965 [Caloplaca aegaea]